MLRRMKTIFVVSCDDENKFKSNGGIKRKSELRKMNHHHSRRRLPRSNYRNIMIQTKFLLLSVMLTICIFIPYGRSLTILLFLETISECNYDMIHISFTFLSERTITLFNCTCIIYFENLVCVYLFLICVAN